MKYQNLNLHFIVLVLLLPATACSQPLTYSAKQIRGQIVDAETDQPLEGVAIVAQWVLFQAGIGHGGHNQRLHIYEAVTDGNGNYVIPAWGPKIRRPLTELDHLDPRLSIFKSGYEPLELVNERNRSDSVRISDWNNKVVKLKKFQGALENYAFLLGSFNGGLSVNDWKSFPRMVLALDAEARRIKSMGLKKGYAPSVMDIDDFGEADRQFLKGFQK